ncbi:MAG TPA: NUDIX hydrolase [Streptosporangiaceae bacterium]|nr:NUDIX hydrolase [Streptosporangiaceae bacterium]
MTTNPADSFARPRVAAGVLFFDEHDRVLLVVPSYKDYRDIPGGYVEHGETPREAAIREVEEELAITPPIGRLIVVDWAPNQTEGDKLLFIFDGETLTTDYLSRIRLDLDELTSYDFHDTADIHDLTIARLARRIVHGQAARQDGTTRYLEHGELSGVTS